MQNVGMSTFELRDLYGRLTEDALRQNRPFSEDVQKLHEIVFHPFRSPGQRDEAYLLWLQTRQPCLFGRIAAAQKRLHLCVLGEEHFQNADQQIAERIAAARIAWKRRSLWPHDSVSNPAHGFLLLAVSQKLALAAPDENLRRFAEKLLALWGCPKSEGQSGTVHSEFLFLRHPQEKQYVRFTFSVDFFMAQGDGRWWHDHRIPGGLGFTANSVGHMRKYQEWFEKRDGQEEWVLQTAMLTIAKAVDTQYGKATWLKPLINGKPFVENLKCPFAHPEKIKPELHGKDWTRYGGHLHTDHSIRPEFFWNDAQKVADITAQEYLQDFAYLFDPRQKDHTSFVVGQNVSENEVFEELGNPEQWVRIVGAPPKKTRPAAIGEDEDDVAVTAEEASKDDTEVELLLKAVRQWVKPSEDV